ncbi:MAG TPA: aspartate aminotransferase family protein, partial [Alphaproteobacteria bacterium]|nr:aspartate aminotransferase family protein [Alphaproteobacteria bacterium]
MKSAVYPTYARQDISFERGEGPYLYTDDGRRFLDFGSGVAVTSLGHVHPRLMAALTEQAGKVWHTSNLYKIDQQERLAERLVDNSFADLVFFSNSGTEAVEAAIKTARKYHAHAGNPDRYRLITFEGSFHGRTLATIAASGSKKLMDGFGPPVPGFDTVKFGDLDAVEAAITEETAGILVEPVQGEGGIRPAPSGFLSGLRALADDHGLLLVFDEIQCGMGRTGKLFGYEWSGVEPDIMALAKGLGGGFPIGACLATHEAAAGMTLGTHGSTFGGNPMACAVGNAVLDVMLEPGFMEHVQKMSNLLRQGLAMIAERHAKVIEDVRGEGLMLGIKPKVANADFIKAALGKGLVTIAAGDNVVRVLPALIIEEDHVRAAI